MCATGTTATATDLPAWLVALLADLPEWVTVTQFAKATGASDTLAGELVRTGLIRGHKHGLVRPVTKIHRGEVARYLLDTLIQPDTDTDTDTHAPGSAA